MTHRTRPTILLLACDALRPALIDELESHGMTTAVASDAGDAIDRMCGFAYDGVVLDLGLPDRGGEQVLHEARARYPDLPVVVLAGHGSVADAVSAMKQGATDFLAAPFPPSALASVLRTALMGNLRPDTAAPVASPGRFATIIGTHPSMQRLFDTLERVSPMHSTVLVCGETGTGKELVARTIHAHSPRANQPFVAFNAAAIPDGLAEAELFGHVKGAFTGAVGARTGRFELAHRGTLFIDEVASMPLTLQAKLLRALQEREIERVGDSRPVKLDIRLIAATNLDLKTLVAEGRFREDLYYRLHVIPVTLPALRDRREDIPLIARRFVAESCRTNGLPAKALGADAMRALLAYSWPGNVRQLENVVEHAVAMSGRSIDIGLDALPPEILQEAGAPAGVPLAIPDEGLNFTSIVSQLERDLILRCLEKTRGNKRQAARLLNLSRTTFIDKLQRISTPMA